MRLGSHREAGSLISAGEILKAREVLRGVALRTPLVPLAVDGDVEILLKLETVQPVNSFKIRGAGNAILQASDDELRDGVADSERRQHGAGCRLRGQAARRARDDRRPEHAPQTKIDAIERLGGRVIRVPYDEWWQVLVDGRHEAAAGLFVHPVDHPLVMAGNGTIGLELLEQATTSTRSSSPTAAAAS